MSDPASLPVSVTLESGGPAITCLDFADTAFPEPFFRQSIEHAEDATSVVRSYQELRARLGSSSEPAGFIFHMSRCGSTLVSQLLKEIPGVRVYAEPPPLNDALFLASELPRRDVRDLLETIIRAFCAQSPRTFFKCSSWNVLEYSLFEELFPEVPKLFVIRQPVEVLASIAKAPPGFVAGRDAFAKIVRRRAGRRSEAFDDVELAAVLLGCFLDAMAGAANGATRIVDYTELPSAVWTTLPSFFGLSVDEIDVARMAAVSGLYSKSYPQQVRFEKEKERATDTDWATLEHHAAKWIGSRYDDLLARS